MRWLSERRDLLGCDTETGGLNWWKDDLRLVQFGDERAGWAIPWHDWAGLVKEVARVYEGEWAFFNLKFDLHYLEREGAAPQRSKCHDAAVWAHLVNPNGFHGLKPLSTQYLNNKLASGQEDLHTWMARKGWTWATVPVDYGPYWSYAALDPVLTVHLCKILSKEGAAYKDVYDLDLATISAVLDMEKRGARVDLDYCAKKREELNAHVGQMADEIKEEFNCGVGNKEVAARLLAEGIILTAETKTGAWKVDAEVLEGIDHPLAQKILTRRKAQKLSNAYFKNLLVDNDNGFVHPDIKTLGARTGRMAVSRPALQQVPRGREVRDAFIAREGNTLVDIDFDQIEQRLTAHFTGDEGMIAAFIEADETGGDFFTGLARRVFSDETIQKSDIRRQNAKSAAYAKVYGAGVVTFAHTVHVSIPEAQRFLDAYDATFPGVKDFQARVIEAARDRLKNEGIAYVNTPWGRRLTGDEEKLYALANYLIQGTAADVLKQKIVDLDSAGMLEYGVLPVHDEILFDVPKAEAEDFAIEAAGIMLETERFTVPLTCKPVLGNSWGDTHG
jgi:DNA polymerase-1